MKATILLSGGMDSSTLLHHIIKKLGYTDVYALTIHYGQKHSREIEAAKWQAAQLPEVVDHKIIGLNMIGDVIKGSSALTDEAVDIPDLDTLDEEARTQPPTYVPNRNMMMLAIAAAYAESTGSRNLFYGAQAQDEYGYWDCTPDFLQRMNAVLGLNRREKVQIEAPFMAMKKAEELRLGLQLGVDFSQTWTCYRGGEKACGSCPTCVERLNAFKDVGIPDPLPYLEGKR